MEKFFLTLIAALIFCAPAFAVPDCEVDDSNGEQNEFWPADMVPHPHPPGSGPSGPGEPEMA